MKRSKMNPEEVRKVGMDDSKRTPPGHNPGGVLHQRRKLPYSTTTMAIGGFLLTGAIFYGVLYTKKKPEADAIDVAKVATGVASPEDTRPKA
ncbi:uncharacterized protein LOC124943021 [Impatiens glandulifera]|uniref:uncharacterized protein LOC124943021 n=1 Tax=Impatiens glandulifera TaxID=253017 RepID=UPI001FB0D421|nr:uncharacterized protein LOC124943021 [Impatiens glandulifera]